MTLPSRIARGTPAGIYENYHGLVILQVPGTIPGPVTGHLQAERSLFGPVAGLEAEYAAGRGQRLADHRVYKGPLGGGSPLGRFDRRHDVVQGQQRAQVRARQDPDAALRRHHRLRRAASIRITSAIEPWEIP